MSEVEAMEKRGGALYSYGHRMMYEAAAKLISNYPRILLEVGVGCGYGLEVLDRNRCVRSYLGIEPVLKDAQYLHDRYGEDNRIKIVCEEWLDVSDEDFETMLPVGADFTFCIEVLEHIPVEDWLPFCEKLCQHTNNTLFFSTPNSETNSHGVATPKVWRELMLEAGFDNCIRVEAQWTTFFMANFE